MIITTATATEVSCVNCPFKLGIRSSRTYHCIIEYTGTVVTMALIIFIWGFLFEGPHWVGQTKHGLHDTSSRCGSSDFPQPIKTSYLHKMWSKCLWRHGACPGDACSRTILLRMSCLPDVCDVMSVS